MLFLSIIVLYDPLCNYLQFAKQDYDDTNIFFVVSYEDQKQFVLTMDYFDFPFDYVIYTQLKEKNKQDFYELSKEEQEQEVYKHDPVDLITKRLLDVQYITNAINFGISQLSSLYFLIYIQDEVWGSDFISSIRSFFVCRQELNNLLVPDSAIFVEPWMACRHQFYFLGVNNQKELDNGQIITSRIPKTDELFDLSKTLLDPAFFNPNIKWLYHTKFTNSNKLTIPCQSYDMAINQALFGFNYLISLYDQNGCFEPAYYCSYLNFGLDYTENTDQSQLIEYQNQVRLKKQTILQDPSSKLALEYKKLYKDVLIRGK
jgi:hypothetical protein